MSPVANVIGKTHSAKLKQIVIGIIAVPPHAAQSALDLLTSAGVKAVLNFAPARLTVSHDIKLRNVDLSIELEGLSYFLQHKSHQ